ncbi:hypothetical protein LINPERHAP1_LOCUS6732 [Linum perenne]
MMLNCRHSKKIVKYDPRFEPYLAPIGLDKLTACLDFTPDPELITALVESGVAEAPSDYGFGSAALRAGASWEETIC